MYNAKSADSYVTGQGKNKTSRNDKGKAASMSKRHITEAYMGGYIARRTLYTSAIYQNE